MNGLQHYGIKGMRWGVRKGNKTDPSTMSDEELKTKIKRMDLEKRYKDLTKDQKTKGRKFEDKVMLTSATTVATAFVTRGMAAAVKKGINVAKVKRNY